MRKSIYPVSLIALALLGACASEQPATPAPAPVVVIPPQQPAPAAQAPAPAAQAQTAPTVVASQPAQLKAGYGRVETISAVPQSAGAGSTSNGDSRRLGVRMEDGTFQYVDTPAANIRVGDRVQFTSDGYIRHPVP
jgi:hypothetical protein